MSEFKTGLVILLGQLSDNLDFEENRQAILDSIQRTYDHFYYSRLTRHLSDDKLIRQGEEELHADLRLDISRSENLKELDDAVEQYNLFIRDFLQFEEDKSEFREVFFELKKKFIGLIKEKEGKRLELKKDGLNEGTDEAREKSPTPDNIIEIRKFNK